MEPIELPTCFVSVKGGEVSILLKKEGTDQENHLLARRAVDSLRSEGVLNGDYSIKVETVVN